VAPFDVGGGLDPLGRAAVDHAQNPAALLGLGDDRFHRIGGGAEDRAHFRDLPDPAQHVDRIAVAQRHHERMAGREGLGVARRDCLEGVVVAVHSRKACARGFVEGDTELHLRNCADDGLVEILDSLDEVTLTDDDVAVLRDFEPNRLELHVPSIISLNRDREGAEEVRNALPSLTLGVQRAP
jgi:hypothetical protein